MRQAEWCYLKKSLLPVLTPQLSSYWSETLTSCPCDGPNVLAKPARSRARRHPNDSCCRVRLSLRVTRCEHSPLTGDSCAVLYWTIHKDFIKHVSLSRRGAPKFHRPEQQLETNYQGAIRLIHIYKVEPCRGTLGLRTAFPS